MLVAVLKGFFQNLCPRIFLAPGKQLSERHHTEGISIVYVNPAMQSDPLLLKILIQIKSMLTERNITIYSHTQKRQGGFFFF